MDVTTDTHTWTTYESPIGLLTIAASPIGITNIHFPGEPPRLPEAARGPLGAVVDQLDAYFAGELEVFDLEADLRGGSLQKLVWEQLLDIPFGSTMSYGEVAGRIDESAYPEGLEPYKRPRVVGAAVGSNPVAIVVPCHRVIGADGSLTGYRGGLERKKLLLELEGFEPRERGPKPSPDSSQLGLL